MRPAADFATERFSRSYGEHLMFVIVVVVAVDVKINVAVDV